MSASYPPGRFIDLDLHEKGTEEFGLPVRPRHLARRIVAWTLIVLACLGLGIGLGFLAGKGGDQGIEVPEPVSSAEAPTPASGVAATDLSQTEASRTVQRRFTGVAVERAESAVTRGLLAGTSFVGGSVPRAIAPPDAPPPAPQVPGGGVGPEQVAAPALSEAAAGNERVAEPASPPTPAAATAEPGADDDDEDDHGDRAPRRDRWSDPDEDSIDYDFSVPFEERDDRSRERLLNIDQSNPYTE